MKHVWWRIHWRREPDLQLIDRFGGFSEVDEVMPGLVEALSLPPGGDVLELGCSHGSYSVRLAQWGYRVVGVEESRQLVDLAQERARQREVTPEFRAGLPWEIRDKQAFDGCLVLDFGGYSDLENSALLRTAADALRPGGRLVFATCNPYFWAVNEITEHHAAGGVDVVRRTSFDAARGALISSVRFIEQDGTRHSLPAGLYRAYTIPELRSMSAAAGLSAIRIAAQDISGQLIHQPGHSAAQFPYYFCSTLRPRTGESGDGI